MFRFCLLLIIVVFGAMAIAQAQRGFKKQKTDGVSAAKIADTGGSDLDAMSQGFQPIPIGSHETNSNQSHQYATGAPTTEADNDQWTTASDQTGSAYDTNDANYHNESYSTQIAPHDRHGDARIVTVSAQDDGGLPPLLEPPAAMDVGSYSTEPTETSAAPPSRANEAEPSSAYSADPIADDGEYPELAPNTDSFSRQADNSSGYAPPEQQFEFSPQAQEPLYSDQQQAGQAHSDQPYAAPELSQTESSVEPLQPASSDNVLRNDLRSGVSSFPAPSSPQQDLLEQHENPEFDGTEQEFASVDGDATRTERLNPDLQPDDMAVGKPGAPELEGPQSATLTLEKSAPSELRVGTPDKFRIVVRNQGNIPAHEVIIRDEVPHGTRLINTVPQAERMSDGSLVWQMGTVKPGGQVSVEVEVMPISEGQVGSVATVAFQSSASARSVVTQPRLAVQQTGPRQVLVGDDVVFKIQLSNPGTGTATNVTLEEDVPDGLIHPAGRELEYKVGTLKPNETRYLELTLKADKPGLVENALTVSADSNLSVSEVVQVEVIAPQIHAVLEGPNRRYLRREATFDLVVSNPGSAPAKEIEIVAHLPSGLKFVNTTNNGYYDSDNHSVHWSLAELPPKQMGTPKLVVLPVEMGPQKVRVDCRAAMNLSDTVDKTLEVEGLAALLFQLADVSDPIEVGGQTTYEIRVVNQGSKTATNIQIVAAIPEGMNAVDASGPTRVIREPRRVVFEALPRLAPKSDATFKIHVQGESPGDKRFRVQMTSDNTKQPVIKEESTKVYSDE